MDPIDDLSDGVKLDFKMTRQVTDQQLDTKPAGQITPSQSATPPLTDSHPLPTFDALSLSQLARQRTDVDLNADDVPFRSEHPLPDDDQKTAMPSFHMLSLSGLERQQTDVANPGDSDSDHSPKAEAVPAALLQGMSRQQTDPAAQSERAIGGGNVDDEDADDAVPNMEPILSDHGSLFRRNTAILNREEVLDAIDGAVGMDEDRHDEPVLAPMSLNELTRQQTDVMLAMANAVEMAMENKQITRESAGDELGAAMPRLDTIWRQTTDSAKNEDDQMMIEQMAPSNDGIRYIPPRVTLPTAKSGDAESEHKEGGDGVVGNEYLDPDLLMFDDDGKLLTTECGGDGGVGNGSAGDGGDEFEDSSLNQFVEHNVAVHCLAFHPEDANKVVSGGQDDKAFIWDILKYDASAIGLDDEEEDRRESGCLELADHEDTVMECGWNRSGKFVATASMDGTLRVYRCSKGMALVSALELDDEVTFMRWHPAEKRRNELMAGGKDKNVWMFEYDKKRKSFENIQILSGHSAEIECGGFTRFNGGQYAFSGDQDGMIVVWDNVAADTPFGGRKKWAFRPQVGVAKYHQSGITAMDDCGAAPLLISGSSDATVCLINFENGKLIRKLGEHPDSVECVQFKNAEDAQYASSSSIDGLLQIWDLNKGSARSSIQHDEGVVVHRWFNTAKCANLIAVGSVGGTVFVDDSRSGETVRSFQGHSATVQALRVSADDRHIVSGGDDSTVRVWRM